MANPLPRKARTPIKKAAISRLNAEKKRAAAVAAPMKANTARKQRIKKLQAEIKALEKKHPKLKSQ